MFKIELRQLWTTPLLIWQYLTVQKFKAHLCFLRLNFFIGLALGFFFTSFCLFAFMKYQITDKVIFKYERGLAQCVFFRLGLTEENLLVLEGLHSNETSRLVKGLKYEDGEKDSHSNSNDSHNIKTLLDSSQERSGHGRQKRDTNSRPINGEKVITKCHWIKFRSIKYLPIDMSFNEMSLIKMSYNELS